MMNEPARKKGLSRETYRKVKNMDRARMDKYITDVYMAGFKAGVEDGRKQVSAAKAQAFASGVTAGRMEAEGERMKEAADASVDEGGKE